MKNLLHFQLKRVGLFVRNKPHQLQQIIKMPSLTSSSSSSAAAKFTTSSGGGAKIPPEDLRVTPKKFITSGPLGIARLFVNLFSTTKNQCNPPPSSKKKTKHVRLITILPSPFCEKIRWILDILQASDDSPYYYTESAHPPGFHAYATLEASNYKASATPMIVYNEEEKEEEEDVDDGSKTNNKASKNKLTWMTKSDLICQKFMPELYPPEIESQIKEMELDFNKRISTAGRCFIYYHTMNNLDKYKDTMVFTCANSNVNRYGGGNTNGGSSSSSGVARVESKLFDKMLDKGLGKGILKGVKVTKEGTDASIIAIKQVFDEISTILESNGGEYIMDDAATKGTKYGFTAADLTFAASSAMLILPPELINIYGGSSIDDDDTTTNGMERRRPPEYVELREQLLQTTAGQHVLKIYKQHRCVGDDALHNIVTIKTAERNKYPWQFDNNDDSTIPWGYLGFATAAAAAATAAASTMHTARS